MTTKEIKVPDIGDFDDVDVIEVHISQGQSINADDPTITLENDKASMDLPAPESGTVREVKVQVGDKVSMGSLIYLLEVEGSSSDSSSKQESHPKASSEPPKESPPPEDKSPEPVAPPTAATPVRSEHTDTTLKPGEHEYPSFEGVHASPSIRRFAREKGVNLTKMEGTGRKGRITREDVENVLSGKAPAAKKAKSPATPSTGSGIPAIPAVDFSKFGEVEELELGRIKKLTAAAMQRSWLNIPHVTHNDEADVTSLDDFRKSLKAEAEKRGVRVTLLGFTMKAVVAALKEFPTFNSSLDPSGEKLFLKKYYNIGIAVDTPNGLVVPVIKSVDTKSVYEISEELMTISSKARDNKLKLADIQGATFTISNLGSIGGTTFTPIINSPEVAILGMTRAKMQPVWNGKDFEPRLMQPLSLSYDHRVIDGAEAARFCRFLATTLEDIRRLLL